MYQETGASLLTDLRNREPDAFAYLFEQYSDKI